MRTLRLHGAGDLRFADVPDPVPGPGEELVRLTAVGLCGSDLHWYVDGRVGGLELSGPLVLGHEMGGVITSGPRAGLRVAIDPADACERCELCVAGRSNLCESTRFAGTPGCDGALAERLAWPSRLLVPVPDVISDPAVPLLESLGVALHALSLAAIGPGTTVGVVGAGPIGLLLVALLRARGAGRIIVTEPLGHRRHTALALGADAVHAVDADGSSAAAMAERVEIAFEVAGVDGALVTACGQVRPGGRVIIVGIPGGSEYRLPAGVARRKGLTFPVARRMQAHHLHAAITLVAQGVIRLDPLVSAVYPFREAPAAFRSLAQRDGLKVVVRPDA